MAPLAKILLAILHVRAAVLVLCASSRCSFGYLTAEDEAQFRRVPWFDWQQALDAYKAEHRTAELLGTNSKDNPNRLKFYPESRIMEDRTVVAFCLLTPDKVNGYRSNSISLHILQLGFLHRRSLLAPVRRLLTPAEQLNCWNYVQESICQPVRDCSKPSNPELRTVGIVTKEGWGIFQLKASRTTQAHYQCISEMQNVLAGEGAESNTKRDVTMSSNVVQLQVFSVGIGEPELHLKSGYPRGQPLSAQCSVNNSKPIGSEFTIELVMIRPPPPGIPGSNSLELLLSVSVKPSHGTGLLDWRGELALLSHHGIGVLCRVTDDWGDRRGQRIASGRFQVMYMFPAYLDNPRVRMEMGAARRNSKQSNYYESPGKIRLLKAEYVVCKADGYPIPEVKWSTMKPKSVWILNETLFVSRYAKQGETIVSHCRVTNRQLNLTDAIEVEIRVGTGAQRILPAVPSFSILLLRLLTSYLT